MSIRGRDGKFTLTGKFHEGDYVRHRSGMNGYITGEIDEDNEILVMFDDGHLNGAAEGNLTLITPATPQYIIDKLVLVIINWEGK